MSPNENAELVPEEELYELFAPRRPERDAFRAGIEERIAAHREGAEDDAADEDAPTLSRFWRSAAALLPLDPSSGAVSGSVAGKALGGKLLPAALALPAMVLASVFGGFLASKRSLERSTADAAPFDPTARRRAMRIGSAEYRALGPSRLLVSLIQFGAILAFVVAWLFGGSLALDALTLVLVFSMAALVSLVRSLANAGLLSRAEITRTAAGLLIMVFVGCFLWFHSMRIGDDLSDLGIGWSSSAILLGIVLCFRAGGQRRQASVALALVLGIALFFNTPGFTRSSAASLADQWAQLDLDPTDLGEWEEAAAIHDALSAVGAQPPDTAEVREQLSRAMRSDAEVSPHAVTAAYQMGLVSDADWAAFAARRLEAYRLDQLQTGLGGINKTPYYQYALPMLLKTREVPAEERQLLAREVLAVWPTPGDHAALARAVMCVRLLDELGQPELVEALGELTHELLSEYWVSDEDARLFSKVGGFTSNPAKFRTSFADHTLHGVELMARFGVPEDIDLRLLRSHLRRESLSRPLVFEPLLYLRAMPRAALLRLREQVGLPGRTWFETLLAERLLIAAVLIVLLCLAAIRIAPAIREEEATGAQP